MPTGSGVRVPVRGGGSGANARDDRQSGFGAVGLGFLSGDVDSDDSDDDNLPKTQPKADPPPIYSTNGSRNNLREKGPDMTATATHRPQQHYADAVPRNPTPQSVGQFPQPAGQLQRPRPEHHQRSFPDPRSEMRVVIPQTVQPVPRPPRPAFINVPEPKAPIPAPALSPHPLEAPRIPIAPAFARPSLTAQQREVKFSAESILRGNSEETLLSRSTPKGAEFWRRFSVVVKEEAVPSNKDKRSTWLVQNQARSSRMSLCVWVIGITLLLAIGGIIALVWFMTHNSPAIQPKALGGGANQSDVISSSTTQRTSSSASPLRTVTGDLPPTTTPFVSQPVFTGAANIANRQLIEIYVPPLPTVAPGVLQPPASHRRTVKRLRN